MTVARQKFDLAIVDATERPAAPRASKVVDITELLKRSVKQAQQPAHRRKAS